MTSPHQLSIGQVRHADSPGTPAGPGPQPDASGAATHAASPVDARLRRRLLAWPAVLGAAALGAALTGVGLLGGCASTPQISADVASFGSWPSGRSAGLYAIERLPSQTRAGQAQDQLEAAAHGALQRAGFSAAASADQADVLVQLGSRQGQVLAVSPWFEFSVVGRWGRPGFGAPYPGRWLGPRHVGVGVGRGFGAGFGFGAGTWLGPDPTRDYREVALMLIDKPSRNALVEVHVRQESRYVSEASVGAMFDAALLGFPQLPEGERTVIVPFTPGG
jgi:hypothetical protein